MRPSMRALKDCAGASGSGRDPDFEDADMGIDAAHLRRIAEHSAGDKQDLTREASHGHPARIGRTICNECNSGASKRAENIYSAMPDAIDSDGDWIKRGRSGDCAEFGIPTERGGVHSLPAMQTRPGGFPPSGVHGGMAAGACRGIAQANKKSSCVIPL